MSLSAPFIARPVATSLLAIAVLLGGALGYGALPVSALPQVDFPTIVVTTSYPGAGPDTMATLVTAPLERQLGQINGLTTLQSSSAVGTSEITLQFDLTRSIDGAAQDVQAAINTAQGILPQSLPYPPTYNRVNPADAPILSLAITSDTVPIDQVADAADTLLQPKLSQIDGVGRVVVQGGLKPAIRVQLDPARLAAYGLSMEDVRTAITAANVSGAKGSFNGAHLAYAVGTNDQLLTPEAYRGLILTWRAGAAVRLSDVGSVVHGVENDRVAAWYFDGKGGGKPAVLLDVQRQPGANIVGTVDAVRAELPELTKALPPGLHMELAADRTQTIRASVSDVQRTLLLSMVLVVGVIFLFLRSWRATLIPAVALPLSLIGTFGIMDWLGYGLDNLSLMALTVASGFVVDDAIVMIENVVRYIEDGVPPLEAAFRGAAQIGFTIVSLTVSLIAVFIPLLFMGGVVGRLFKEFSVTLSVAVAVSAVVSLTLTPMMCGRLLRPYRQAPPSRTERFFGGVLDGYRRSLLVTLRHQGLVLGLAVLTLVGTIVLYVVVPKGFLPQQDTGSIVVTTEAAQNVSIPAMSALQLRAAAIVGRDPAVAGVASLVGAGSVNPTPNVGRLSVVLKPRRERVAVQAVIARLQSALAAVPGLSVFLQPVQDIQIGARISRTQYQYTLTDTDAAELGHWAPLLIDRLRALPDLDHVTSDQQPDGFATEIVVDRDRATRLGVTMQAIEDVLYDAFGQRQVSTIYQQSNQYRVVMQADPGWIADPGSLARLRVPGTVASFGANGAAQVATSTVATTNTVAQVPLLAVARLVRRTAPLVITHQSQFPSVTISFDVRAGASLGRAVQAVAQAEQGIGLPPTIVGSYSGDAAEFQRSLAAEPWLILAAVAVIYIVLGVLYESFIHPVTILSTLPSAGIGALLALMLTGSDLSVVALVGIVLLMGIVKKNGILVVDFALEAERTRGLSPEAAAVEACVLRFRPIMMTTAAALLGSLPLVLDHGTGSELRRPLGVAIVGGLLLSQVLTLYTTPAIYVGFERARRRFARAPRAGLAVAE
jgi:multidrug efflux pump